MCWNTVLNRCSVCGLAAVVSSTNIQWQYFIVVTRLVVCICCCLLFDFTIKIPHKRTIYYVNKRRKRQKFVVTELLMKTHMNVGGGRATAVEGGGLPHFKVIKQLARNHFTAAFLLADSWWTCGWLTIHLHYIWPKVRQTVWLRSTDERLVIFAWFKLELSIKTHPSIINNHVM